MNEDEYKNIIESLILIAKEKYPKIIKGNNLSININKNDGSRVSHNISYQDIFSILYNTLFHQDRKNVTINNIGIIDNDSGIKLIEISVQ